MKNSFGCSKIRNGVPSTLRTGLCIAAVLTATIPASLKAAVIYDEAVSGDLSSLPNAPTSLSVSLGDNEVHGTTGNPGAVDADFFTFNVPSGDQLSAIIPLAGTQTVGPGLKSFFGVVAAPDFGATIPAAPGALLGYHLYSSSEIGTDILPGVATGPGATGFTGPLGAGTYAFWIQEGTPASSVAYGFDFKIGFVPEGGAGMGMTLASFGLLLAAGATRRFGHVNYGLTQ